jgi:Ca2+/Na+ antiporter
MGTLFMGGAFSLVIIIWTLISIPLTVIIYFRCSRHLLLVLGTLLGSIIFLLGVTGQFSAMVSSLINLGNSISKFGTTEIAVGETVSKARIPFYIGTLITIVFFCLLIIMIKIKKGTLQKWVVWSGWIIFLLFTTIFTYARQSLNSNSAQSIGKLMGSPEKIIPYVKAGRLSLITSVLLSFVYLLIAVLVTIHKSKKEEKQTGEKQSTDSSSSDPNTD